MAKKKAIKGVYVPPNAVPKMDGFAAYMRKKGESESFIEKMFEDDS
jgi:hypothetical protein